MRSSVLLVSLICICPSNLPMLYHFLPFLFLFLFLANRRQSLKRPRIFLGPAVAVFHSSLLSLSLYTLRCILISERLCRIPADGRREGARRPNFTQSLTEKFCIAEHTLPSSRRWRRSLINFVQMRAWSPVVGPINFFLSSPTPTSYYLSLPSSPFIIIRLHTGRSVFNFLWKNEILFSAKLEKVNARLRESSRGSEYTQPSFVLLAE